LTPVRAPQSATAAPPRLTEAALIAAMERYGIGTDATVAEHIQKQLERGCAATLLPAGGRNLQRLLSLRWTPVVMLG